MMRFTGLEWYARVPPRLVVAISGGRSSGMAAWHLVERHGIEHLRKMDVVFTFQNTSLELEETYVFLDRIDRHLGLGIVWLEADPDAPAGYRVVTLETAARRGEVFNKLLTHEIPRRRDGTSGVRPLPNPVQRVCTSQLKIKTVHRYVRHELGWPTDYRALIGIRADEMARYERRLLRQYKKQGLIEGGAGWYPLLDSGVLREDVHNFWQSAPFDHGIDSDRGNCDFCFMKSTWKIKEQILLLSNQPERIQRWIEWEDRADTTDRPGPFRRDRPSFRQLVAEVQAGNMQSSVPEGRDDRCGACTD